MGYIDSIGDICNRMHLQHLSEFLLVGSESLQISDKSHEERIRDADEKITNIIKENFSDEFEADKMLSHIFELTNVYEHVYLEVGIKCGFSLYKQLTETVNE